MDDLTLASRFSRFLAALVDMLVIMIPSGLVFWLMVSVFGFTFDVENQKVDIELQIVSLVVSFGLFFLINYKRLRDNGQTLGKEVLGVKIVNLQGELIPINQLIAKRLVPFWLFPLVPVVGGVLNIVNLLFIFGKPRRCIHDLIGGSQVIAINKTKHMDLQ